MLQQVKASNEDLMAQLKSTEEARQELASLTEQFTTDNIGLNTQLTDLKQQNESLVQAKSELQQQLDNMKGNVTQVNHIDSIFSPT